MRKYLYGLVMVLTQVPLAGTAAEVHVVGAASSGGTTVIRATASGSARVRIHGVAEQGGRAIIKGESHGGLRIESNIRPRIESPVPSCCCGGKSAPRSPSRSCHGVTRVTAIATAYQGGCNTGYQRVYTTSRSCQGVCHGASGTVARGYAASGYAASGEGIAQGVSYAKVVVGPGCGGSTAFAVAESRVTQY